MSNLLNKTKSEAKNFAFIKKGLSKEKTAENLDTKQYENSIINLIKSKNNTNHDNEKKNYLESTNINDVMNKNGLIFESKINSEFFVCDNLNTNQSNNYFKISTFEDKICKAEMVKINTKYGIVNNQNYIKNIFKMKNEEHINKKCILSLSNIKSKHKMVNIRKVPKKECKSNLKYEINKKITSRNSSGRCDLNQDKDNNAKKLTQYVIKDYNQISNGSNGKNFKSVSPIQTNDKKFTKNLLKPKKLLNLEEIKQKLIKQENLKKKIKDNLFKIERKRNNIRSNSFNQLDIKKNSNISLKEPFREIFNTDTSDRAKFYTSNSRVSRKLTNLSEARNRKYSTPKSNKNFKDFSLTLDKYSENDNLDLNKNILMTPKREFFNENTKKMDPEEKVFSSENQHKNNLFVLNVLTDSSQKSNKSNSSSNKKISFLDKFRKDRKMKNFNESSNK